MNIAEMKVVIFETLAQTHDEKKVAQFYEAIYLLIEEEVDWWDELTPEQQTQLSKSIEDSHNPDNWIDYDDFKEKQNPNKSRF